MFISECLAILKITHAQSAFNNAVIFSPIFRIKLASLIIKQITKCSLYVIIKKHAYLVPYHNPGAKKKNEIDKLSFTREFPPGN